MPPDDFRGAAPGIANAAAKAAAAALAATPQQILDAKATTGSSASNSNGNLPWAVVLLPTTAAGHSGIGQNKHGLVEESWVFGFFADGDNAQQPIIVGTIPRGENTTSPTTTPNTPDQGSTGTTPGTPSLTPSTPGSRTAAPFLGSTASIQKAFEVLMRPPTSLTKEQAAGVIGNLLTESNLKPSSIRKGDSPKSACHPDAIGIAQWNDVRAVSLKNYASCKGTDWTDFETQLEFVQHELLNSQPGAMSALKNAGDVISAADAFCIFEKPQGYTREFGCANAPTIKKRRGNAQSAYDSIASLQLSSQRGAGV